MLCPLFQGPYMQPLSIDLIALHLDPKPVSGSWFTREGPRMGRENERDHLQVSSHRELSELLDFGTNLAQAIFIACS